MEEKKKRWRPSLTAYRALESENAELKEHLSRISLESANAGKEAEAGTVVTVEEYNGLFCKYSLLQKHYDALEAEKADAESKLNSEISTLKQSNSLVEAEIKRLRLENEKLGEKCRLQGNEITRLQGRSFWQRVFNK